MLNRVAITPYLYVQNLFNRQNEIYAYRNTGTVTDDDLESVFTRDFIEENAFVLYDLINIGHRQHYQIFNSDDLFGHPREIRFGIRIGL